MSRRMNNERKVICKLFFFSFLIGVRSSKRVNFQFAVRIFPANVRETFLSSIAYKKGFSPRGNGANPFARTLNFVHNHRILALPDPLVLIFYFFFFFFGACIPNEWMIDRSAATSSKNSCKNSMAPRLSLVERFRG